MPTENKTTQEKSIVENPGRTERLIAVKATQMVWLLFGILEALIALRIGLKLIAANPANLVVIIIYGITEIFLWPFQGITSTPSIGNVVLEIPSIIAMLVYALIGWILMRVIWVIFDRPQQRTEEVTQTSTREDHHP